MKAYQTVGPLQAQSESSGVVVASVVSSTSVKGSAVITVASATAGLRGL